MVSIRKPAVAGQFYPENPEALNQALAGFFQPTNRRSFSGQIKALLVPHAGYSYSGQTAAWGYRQLPKTLTSAASPPSFVLIGPSHHHPFNQLVADNHTFWQTPLGSIHHLIPQPVSKLVTLAATPHQAEHCLEIQLPFLQFLYPTFSMTGFLTGQAVDLTATTTYLLNQYPHSLFIISSDLSHYLSLSQTRIIDAHTQSALTRLDAAYFANQSLSACGHWAIAILLTMAKLKHWRLKIIYTDTSATASTNTDQVVSYLSAVLYE